MTIPWHVRADHADAYLRGAVDEATASSIDAHLLACGRCRQLLAEHTAAAELAVSWARIEALIDCAPTGLTAQVAARLGVPDHVVRVLAPTRALRLAGMVASVIGFLIAALLARSEVALAGDLGRLVFLTIAPMVPLVAVVSALGVTGDPAAELTSSVPIHRLWLVALRAGVVLGFTISVGLLVSVVVPGPWVRAVAWLAPSLGVSGIGALVARRVVPSAAIAITGSGWVGLVGAAATLTDDRLAAFRATPQVLYLAAAVAAVAALAVSSPAVGLGSR